MVIWEKAGLNLKLGRPHYRSLEEKRKARIFTAGDTRGRNFSLLLRTRLLWAVSSIENEYCPKLSLHLNGCLAGRTTGPLLEVVRDPSPNSGGGLGDETTRGEERLLGTLVSHNPPEHAQGGRHGRIADKFLLSFDMA